MNRLVDLLRLGYRAGAVRFGQETLDKIRGRCVVLAATDLSERTKRYILSKPGHKVYVCFTKETLSKIFGKNNIGVVIIKEGSICREIEKILDNLTKEAFIEEHYSKTAG